MDKKWYFVPNLYSDEDGLNDAGIETFSADAEKSMIREVIQNAIDQHVGPETEPVKVVFGDFEIKPDEFPGYDQFCGVLDSCIESAGTDNNVRDFFNLARKTMNNPIRVLKISDYNTTGLVGAETGASGTPWHNLIKSKGSSNKNMTSGGSFGIGKSAPFACSTIRTVLYASKVEDINSYVGVARLISHKEGENITRGTGFYSDCDKLTAILSAFSLGADKYRTTNGTDLYIMGYNGDSDLRTTIKESVLKNFFISIHNGLLEVVYGSLIINKKTLGQHIASLKSEGDNLNLQSYYALLLAAPDDNDPYTKRIELNSNEFGKKYGIKDKECTLLLKRGDDMNRRILMTRKIGMSLFEQDRISGSISFTGILLITGDKMNDLFKAMEMPAHDAWEPKRCTVNRSMYVNAFNDLKSYLREKVEECFGQSPEEAMTAFGMEEFFNDYNGPEGKREDSSLEGNIKFEIKKEKPISRKKSKLPIFPTPDPDPNPDPNPDPDPNPIPNPEPLGKFVDIKKRLKCIDQSTGKYEVSFNVDKKKKLVTLVFIGIGERSGSEQKNFNMSISDVSVSGTTYDKIEVKNNRVMITNIPSACRLAIAFKMDFTRRCMMEVDYYET